MPQHPKLRKKNVGNATYWYTEAGGPTYLGNVDEVPYKEAKKLFAAHTQSLLDEKKDSKEKGFTTGDLIEVFLAWINKYRSHSSYTSKRIYCSRFGDFKIGNNKIAVFPPDKIKASDLEAFLGQMEEEGFNPRPASMRKRPSGIAGIGERNTRPRRPILQLPSVRLLRSSEPTSPARR